MRLGQLSRKVNVKPTVILSYLKNEFDIELNSHLNTKVDDELAEKVTSKFIIPIPILPKEAPEKTASNIENIISNTDLTPLITESVIENKEEQAEPPVIEFEINQEVDAETIQNAELIKAPKIELTGPKIIGKIELPPSLEEQMVEVDGVMISKAEIANRKREERKEKREQSIKRKTRNSGDVRKSRAKSEAQLTQIKRDKEALEMAKRLAHREKRITERKKAVKNTNPTFVPKQQKKKTKKITEQKRKKEIKKPKPTTWHGKLWLWFNT